MRVALVTGGGRGIGLGIARRLAGCEFDLAICGRRPEEDVARELDDLRQAGARTMYVRADVGDRSGRASLVDAVRSE